MTYVTPQYLAEQGFNSTFPSRFFDKIQYTDSCWLWTAWKLPRGYGLIGRGGRGQGMELAHRASWILHFGPIPDGLDVCHDCPDGDNPSCVNPGHLWVGTLQDNTNDKMAKGAYKAAAPCGEMNGHHKLTLEQVETIRQNYVWKYGAIRDLALRYGVAWQTIWNILHHKVWKSGNSIKPITLRKQVCSTR